MRLSGNSRRRRDVAFCFLVRDAVWLVGNQTCMVCAHRSIRCLGTWQGHLCAPTSPLRPSASPALPCEWHFVSPSLLVCGHGARRMWNKITFVPHLAPLSPLGMRHTLGVPIGRPVRSPRCTHAQRTRLFVVSEYHDSICCDGASSCCDATRAEWPRSYHTHFRPVPHDMFEHEQCLFA